ncbi:MAG: hypothetical protein LUQ08_01115, partial [Methanothrix sp.]|nr:hypothetical protein [Methanothrix sp.]
MQQAAGEYFLSRQAAMLSEAGNEGSCDLDGIYIIGRNTGREAVLSDFSEDEQRDLLAYSKWNPDQAMHGQIAIITAKMAREIMTRGVRIQFNELRF